MQEWRESLHSYKRNNQGKKRLFLTYEGLSKVIFSSGIEGEQNFIKWASHTLFIHQFGEQQDKDKLMYRHYKYFFCKKAGNPSLSTEESNKVKKRLFLTYEGLLKAIFSSRTEKTQIFKL